MRDPLHPGSAAHALTTRPLTSLFGAEIISLDLSRTSATVAAEVLRLLDTQGVLVMRGQRLTLPQLEALGRSLGPLASHAQAHCSPPGHPEVLMLSNIIEHGQPIGYPDAARHWQSIGAHLKTPHRATLQYAVEIPRPDGVALGDTWFADTRAACDALAPALRQQLTGMRAAHVLRSAQKKRSTPYFPDSGLTQLFRRGVEHPVLRAHPHSRRRCLYVNPVTTSHICGMHERDSDALLNELYAHLARPEFVYRHAWQAGDLVLWDNASTQFRTAADYELPLRRLIYRTVIKEAPAR
jgi:taurine dioxygenase